METCINHSIVFIGRLCRKYCGQGWSKPQMDDLAGFCYDLLVISVCLALPAKDGGQWNEAILSVDKSLKEEHVEFYDKAQKIVRLTGYTDEGDSGGGKYGEQDYYLRYLFLYTYCFTSGNDISRMKFLWVSLILPYLYRMNQYEAVKVEELDRLLKDYPIMDENTLEVLQQDTENFEQLIKDTEGMIDSIPIRQQTDSTVDEAKAGLKIAAALMKKEKEAEWE
ncbi:MAG: hypothetical protein NC489_39695 [Ruminococcus flavefaciens]|nr:hypothetical protein [Ruminococcus flavefaciens]